MNLHQYSSIPLSCKTLSRTSNFPFLLFDKKKYIFSFEFGDFCFNYGFVCTSQKNDQRENFQNKRRSWMVLIFTKYCLMLTKIFQGISLKIFSFFDFNVKNTFSLIFGTEIELKSRNTARFFIPSCWGFSSSTNRQQQTTMRSYIL